METSLNCVGSRVLSYLSAIRLAHRMDFDRRPGTPGLETKVFIAPGITSRVSFIVRILVLLQFHEGDTEYIRVTPVQQVCVTAEETLLFYNLLSSCKLFQPLPWGK